VDWLFAGWACGSRADHGQFAREAIDADVQEAPKR
jgi:hypothetical protein